MSEDRIIEIIEQAATIAAQAAAKAAVAAVQAVLGAETQNAMETAITEAARVGAEIGAQASVKAVERERKKFRDVIPELPKPKTTALDAILDALSLTFKATGIRYYVMSSGGKLSLIRRRENLLQWVIETGVNLESYDYSVSIEKIKTRIKLLSKEDTVVAEAANAELEKLIGVFQDIDKPDDNMEQANITDMVKAMLDEQSLPDKSLSISALGLPDVISGIGVFVTIQLLLRG